ncbi:putative colanic acid biosynthesis acetyltransferase [Shinella oryzae]|uniref:putative colanic acid biosynthesis acetyltransferase n=1 Tax=Shinella oryzae TaxID=2871820 RepID=UPI001FF20E01|nr:putative colanic acid biosynthesis acetyltransferase [Shinella oryzae]UPA27548.1 putative colanic acid biosynthesis acetyltransferase [Shinella oryzae]
MKSRYDDPAFDAGGRATPLLGGPTFALRFRLMRLAWLVAWRCLAAWTPSPFHPWRNLLLRLFGAKVHPTAIVHGSTVIWWPGNLTIGRNASMGPGVICYNVAPVTLEALAVVSQRAHLCTGTHDIHKASFPLVARPITLRHKAWVAAEAFVGPGTNVGEGAVLGARGVAVKSLEPWTVYAGNPAKAVASRRRSADGI